MYEPASSSGQEPESCICHYSKGHIPTPPAGFGWGLIYTFATGTGAIKGTDNQAERGCYAFDQVRETEDI